MMERIREVMQKYEMTETQILILIGLGANRMEQLDADNKEFDHAVLMNEFKKEVLDIIMGV